MSIDSRSGTPTLIAVGWSARTAAVHLRFRRVRVRPGSFQDRSGCTNTESMVIEQDMADELWLGQRDWWGFWFYSEGFDSSFWKAFGGRSLRFIWRSD